MKRVCTLLLAFFLSIGISACGNTEAPPDAPEPPPAAEPGPVSEVPPPPPEPTPEELAAQRVDDLLNAMTWEEKVGQLFFVRCPADNTVSDISTYHLGGYVLFSRDMKDSAGNWLTKEQLTQTIQGYQDTALADTGIPLLIGSDEEGGSVTRASKNPNLFDHPFRSPQYLLKNQHEHGDIFAEDAWEKNSALLTLGINVNLAPVCDVATNPDAFIYDRTLGKDATATSEFISITVGAMRDAGIGSVLKHFPGYGHNVDTHTGIAVDERPYEQFLTADFLPFRAGILAGKTEDGCQHTSVLVSHNIVTCMDGALPASLSSEVHRVLREQLDFDGVIMTDDLAMDAVEAYATDGAVAVMAIAAGNDLVITTDYRKQIPKVLKALESGILSEEVVETACRRVLTWKQTLGLIP